MSDTPEVDPTIGVLDPTTPGVSLPLNERRPELPKGRFLGERYEIIKLLGRGGMGAVYAAQDHKLDRQVALKLLHSTREDAPERLVTEAKALARLSDPHVVAIYDAGDLDGQVFIAMQLVDGEDLATALARRRPTLQQIISWFADAGRGLAAAHAAHLVHRDFKPSNVLIDRNGHVAVTDFGLARTTTGAARGLTGMGVMLGTPAYMSPEQHTMQPANEASDQFSFCVALWESLFGQHPYIQGDRGSMSPFEMGYQIFDGPLVPPPKNTRVSRKVIEALMRGLQRDPAKRWTSISALVAEIEPKEPKRRVWPLVAAAGIVAAALGGAAVWSITREGATQSCETQATARVRSAWSPDAWTKVREQFAKAGRKYGDAAARQASSSLDGYAAHWSRLAADVCAAERAQSGSGSQLAALRRACLDGKLDALRGLAGLLASEIKPVFVDHAQEMVDGLPDLAECADVTALLAAPGVPPPDKAAAIAKLEIDLGTATARSRGGEYERAVTDLAAIIKTADALGWASLRARAHLALGEVQTHFGSARDELILAGELATANHLDRDAARAWALAAQDAGYYKQADAVAVLVPLARAAADRTGDRALHIAAEIAAGRAWLRLRNYKDALATCKAALATAQTLDRSEQIDNASDCLVEAMAPLGAFKELEPILAERIESKSRVFGAEHPKVADLMAVRAQMEMLHGQLDLARKDADGSLDIRLHTYPPRHVKIAEGLKVRGQLAAAEGKLADAKRLYEEALAIAVEVQPEPLTLLAALHQALAQISQASQDNAGALKHYEDGITVMRKLTGNSSLELAMLLLNYGQLEAASSFAAGLAIIDEARAILDRAHDPRAAIASGVMASMEFEAKKWQEARGHAEEALRHPEVYTPDNIAELTWDLAQAIVETKGDAKRARELALSARAIYVTLGPAGAAPIKKIDAWLRSPGR